MFLKHTNLRKKCLTSYHRWYWEDVDWKTFIGIGEFTGNEPNTEKWEQTKHFIYSIGQDVCLAVSQGRWKFRKNIVICVNLRRLYRSKQLTTILSRRCHCKSYFFGLELKTVMAKAIDEADTYLTPQTVTGNDNLVFHSE